MPISPTARPRASRRTLLRLLVAVGCSATLLAPATAAQAGPPTTGEPSSDRRAIAVPALTMPKRSANKLGANDTSAWRDYINPPSWKVQLDACSSYVTDQTAISSYRWDVAGVNSITTTKCRTSIKVPALGFYPVTLTVTTADGLSGAFTYTPRVHDYLIVTMGDSAASGEGNPDRPAHYASLNRPFQAARWKSRQCHRSGRSGPALAAAALESDPETSVTFVNVACSGAKITDGPTALGKGGPGRGGLLDPYVGIKKGKPLRAQLPEVAARVNGRPIDVLIISAGINDVSFSQVVKKCLKTKYYCSRAKSLVRGKTEAFIAEELPKRYEQLHHEIMARFPGDQRPRKTLMMTYPDPTKSDGAKFLGLPGIDGGYCTRLLDFGAGRFDLNETIWAHDKFLDPMNAQIRAQVERSRADGWDVTDVEGRFTRNGYCAGNKNRYFVRMKESLKNQRNADGSLHPDLDGQRVVAQSILERIARVNQIG
jgi:hypothetical protein